MIVAQRDYASVSVHDDVLRYLLAIVERTRSHEDVIVGVSPRGSQALLRASQVYAIIRGRDYVTPDDVKAMAGPVLAHRVVLRSALRYAGQDGAAVMIDAIVKELPVPAESEKLPEMKGS